jgi:hypothetical protein
MFLNLASDRVAIGVVDVLEEVASGLLENGDVAAGGHAAALAHHGGGLENSKLDAILWIWTIASCLDEFYKYAMNPKSFQASGWNQFDYLTFAVVQLGLTVRFVSLERSVETECFAVILVWVRILKFLQLDYNLGVLVIILMRMTKDIVVWGVVTHNIHKLC